jgi:hypothetical protein
MRREIFAKYWEEFDTKLEQALGWQGRDYAALLPRPLRGWDRDVCPAFVFALAADGPCPRRDAVELALALEYSYLSFREHRLAWNADLPERERQYGMLFGDFFAAQALAVLSGDLLFPHYAVFTALIRTMNEGVLLRRRLNRETMGAEDWRAVLGREKAALVVPVRVLADWLMPARRETQFLASLAAELSVLWGAREEGQLPLGRGSLAAAEGLLAAAPMPPEDLRAFVADLTGEGDAE